MTLKVKLEFEPLDTYYFAVGSKKADSAETLSSESEAYENTDD